MTGGLVMLAGIAAFSLIVLLLDWLGRRQEQREREAHPAPRHRTKHQAP